MPSNGSLTEAGPAGERRGLGVAGFGLPGCRIDKVQKRCTIPAKRVATIPFAGATKHGLAGFALAFAHDGEDRTTY